MNDMTNKLKITIDLNDYDEDGIDIKSLIESGIKQAVKEKAIEEIVTKNILIFERDHEVIQLKNQYEQELIKWKQKRSEDCESVRAMVSDVFTEFLGGEFIEVTNWGEEKRRIKISDFIKEEVTKGMGNARKLLEDMVANEVNKHKPDMKKVQEEVQKHAIDVQNQAVKAVVCELVGEQSEKLLNKMAIKMVEKGSEQNGK